MAINLLGLIQLGHIPIMTSKISVPLNGASARKWPCRIRTGATLLPQLRGFFQLKLHRATPHAATKSSCARLQHDCQREVLMGARLLTQLRVVFSNVQAKRKAASLPKCARDCRENGLLLVDPCMSNKQHRPFRTEWPLSGR